MLEWKVLEWKVLEWDGGGGGLRWMIDLGLGWVRERKIGRKERRKERNTGEGGGEVLEWDGVDYGWKVQAQSMNIRVSIAGVVFS